MKTVVTIGTFDLLHPGHLDLLRACREVADQRGLEVVVGVNSDEFIFRYKGRLPVMPFGQRAELIQACRYVDRVVCNPQNGQDQISVKPLLQEQGVEVLVVGSDWLPRDYLAQIGVTREDVEELGCTFIFKPYFAGVSSTELRQRLQADQYSLAIKGSGTLIVVPCHNPPRDMLEATCRLENVLLIDNGSHDLSAYFHAKSPETNFFGPTYEAGALFHAFQNYEYDRYLLMQDSIVIEDTTFILHPESHFDGASGVYAFASIAPASVGMTGENYDFISRVFPEFSSYDLNTVSGIQYNSFSISRADLEKVVAAGFLREDRLPKCKRGSEAWERIWGCIFAELGIPISFLGPVGTTDHPVFKKRFMGRN